MLEARLAEASILKKLLDAIKELVTDANFECNEEGINLQAMDNSHVALVSVKLEAASFRKYRCDRPIPLGVNLGSLTKVLKCAKDDDICTLKAADDADVLNLVYESKGSDRIAEYDMKLMEIDSDQLGIPDTEYDSRVTMPSAEFARIVRDLSQLGESVRIEVSKEGVRFISDGEAANGSVLLKQPDGREIGKVTKGLRKGDDDDDDENEEEDEEEDKEPKIKKEKADGDVQMNEDDEAEKETEEFQLGSDEEVEGEEGEGSKKRKKTANGKSKPSKKAKTSSKKRSIDEDDGPGLNIEMNQHVSLTFSLKYLVNFSKSASLTGKVQLMMSSDVPLLVAYYFGQGYIHYYLAPKIGDE